MAGIATGDRAAVGVPNRLIVKGADRLHGQFRVPGAKNAVLPMIAAALLTDEPCHLSNVPVIEDVERMVELVRRLGAQVEYDRVGRTMTITADRINNFEPDAEMVNEMRASFLVAGPLLTRFAQFRCVHPGGCDLGIRPVNVDVQGFRAMGAKVETERSSYVSTAPRRLQGARIYLDYPSHTGTEDLVMAACLAEGTTTIRARVPGAGGAGLGAVPEIDGGAYQGRGNEHHRGGGQGEVARERSPRAAGPAGGGNVRDRGYDVWW